MSENGQIIAVGDIHGDYESFRRIHSLFNPNLDYLLFLGDYADRGPQGIEVIDGVKVLLEEYPSRVIALKGNHEDYTEDGRPKFVPCDLIREAVEKSGDWGTYFKEELRPFIDKLYLTALIPNEALFVHGGISRKVKSLDSLRYPSTSVAEDLLWSDPFEGEGEHISMRGAGVAFGRDVSEEVCQILKVRRIVRSHQPRKAREGPHTQHDGRIVTISSTRVYGGTPFILALPTRKLSEAFTHLEKHVVRLR
jgi:hypothetical protein